MNQEYFNEIINSIDFTSLNIFLNDHFRTEMTFEELLFQISTNGLDALDGKHISTFFFDLFFYELSIVRPIFVKMLCFSILFSVVHRLLANKNKYISQVSFLTIYVTLVVLLMQAFLLVKEVALEGLNSLLVFLNALIPTYAVVLAFSGNAVTGALLYETAFMMIYLVEMGMKFLLSPLIHIFVLVLFLNHLFEEDKLSKLAQLIEKGIQLVLKGAFGAVIGLGVIQSMITPAQDRLMGNSILSGLSSIPGVGNTIGSAGEIILSCGMLIKNGIGVIGLLMMAVLAVIPLIKMALFWLMYHGLAVLLQPIADKRLTECVSSVARGCDLYMKIVLYSILLFFVLFSVLTVATSFIY